MLLPLTIVMNIRIREMYIRIHFLWTWFIFWLIWTVTEHNVKRIGHGLPVLCPSPGCQIWVRVRVITSESESESESSPQSQSPSPSQKFFSSPSHESMSPHIQHLFIIQNMKTNNKMYRKCQSKQRNTARPLHCLDSGVTRARVTSHDFWVWVRVRVKVKETGLESESE